MAADFGEANKLHEHGKPVYRQHVPLDDSGSGLRHEPTDLTSTFASTARLEVSLDIFSSGLTCVRLYRARGEACCTGSRSCAFVRL